MQRRGKGTACDIPSQLCLAGHDRCPRSMPLPSRSSAGRAHGRSRRALKLQGGPGHVEVVALNGCSAGTGLAMGTAPWGPGMKLHPACLGAHPACPGTAAPGARSRSGSRGVFTWGGRRGAAPAGGAYTGVRGCHHAPLAPPGPPHHPRLLGCTQARQGTAVPANWN